LVSDLPGKAGSATDIILHRHVSILGTHDNGMKNTLSQSQFSYVVG